MEEVKKDLKVNKTHFISVEGARLYDYPLYLYNPASELEPYHIAKYKGEYYKLKPTHKPQAGPIRYLESGKNNV